MNQEFEVHMLNAAGKEKANQIAHAFDNLLIVLTQINPFTSREMSLCKTKLEVAAFFAKKAMAKLPDNQE